MTSRTEQEQTEWDQTSEQDETPEKDDTNRNQSVDVMIALCVCLAEPAAVNSEPQTVSGEANALVVTIESASASAQVTFAVATAQPLQPGAPQPMEPTMKQPPLDAAESKDAQKPSGESKPAVVVAPLIPSGDQAGSATTTTSLEAQPFMDHATLASGRTTDEEAPAKNEPVKVSSSVSSAGDMSLSRNATNGIETWQLGDHPATDLMVEQRALAEWSQSGAGQNDAMGERDNQAAGGRPESPQPGQQPAPRAGFGDQVAAMTVEKAAQADGGASRTAASSMTGRAASSWLNGEEHPHIVQAVSLDLEPADLGPVNVRIFMSDRTVHAHIRTDHMDFGQGVLGQQQQLETKLQSSGLEMGELKVTVDHQQLSRGDSQGWLGHQGDRRPSTVDSLQRVPEGEARDASPVERRRHTGIMSFFA